MRSAVVDAFCETVVPGVEGDPLALMGVSAVDLGVPERMSPESDSVLVDLLGADFASLGLGDRTVRLNSSRRHGRAGVVRASPATRRGRRPVLRADRGRTQPSLVGYRVPRTAYTAAHPGGTPEADPRARPGRGGGHGHRRRLRDRLWRRWRRHRGAAPAGGAVGRRPRAGRLHERIRPPAGRAARRSEDVPERWDHLVRDRPDGRPRRWHARRRNVRELARLLQAAGRRPRGVGPPRGVWASTRRSSTPRRTLSGSASASIPTPPCPTPATD